MSGFLSCPHLNLLLIRSRHGHRQQLPAQTGFGTAPTGTAQGRPGWVALPRRGPTWAVAAAEPSPGGTSRGVWCLPLRAADHLSTGGTRGTGRDQDFSSLLLLLGETDDRLHLDQPLSVSLPFKRRSSCPGSGKRHKGFCLPWLTSGDRSLTVDLLAFI